MKNGTRPHRIKRADKDYLPSFHPELYKGTRSLAQELQIRCGAPQFPAEFLTDNTGWKPSQNAEGQPFGCTNYATVKVARILGSTTANVIDLEAVTHANALGGFSALASLDAAIGLGWLKGRFLIQSTGALDYFDTCRLAQVSGLPELRAISSTTPWFPSWEKAAQMGQKVMPMPTVEELAQIRANVNAFSWHDYVRDGWSQNFADAPGQLLYRLDSWQGPLDYLYVDRVTLNIVMDLYGTVDAVGTNQKPIALTHMSLPDWFWSLWHSW